jgi:hypothetical protein
LRLWWRNVAWKGGAFVGWALPTNFFVAQRAMVGRAHPTVCTATAIQEFFGSFFKKERLSSTDFA